MSTDKDQVPPSKELPARYVTPQRVVDRLTGAAEAPPAPAFDAAAFVIGNPPFSTGQSTQA